MRTNFTRLLGQFGFGVNNDLLAAVIVLLAFSVALTLVSAL